MGKVDMKTVEGFDNVVATEEAKNIEVTGEETVPHEQIVSGTETTADIKKERRNITAKTLGAFKEMVIRIRESKLLKEEDMKDLERVANEVRSAWIEQNM